jgi:tetratricopeptide (TPR) repeat protein
VLGLWHFRRGLALARQDISQRRWTAAAQRLETLGPLGTLWGGDEAAYLLGLSEWNAGKRQSALEAFRKIPAGSRFEASAAAFQAEALVMEWQFRAAEERLLRVMRPGRIEQATVRAMLVKLARMELRLVEVRTWLREEFVETDNPVGLLRELWLLDRGRAPMQAIKENLEEALRRSPDDDRVWLGLGRAATLEGQFDQASAWLRRCSDRSPQDRAVLRAWRDWGRASGSVKEVAWVLAGQLAAELDPVERLADRAWMAQRQGCNEEERRALECWLQREPHNPEALERLGTLTAAAGESARAAELRQRKARVDDALAAYQRQIEGQQRFSGFADRLRMAQLAEKAGRPFDSTCWCSLADRLEPGNTEVMAIRARLDGPLDTLPCEGAELAWHERNQHAVEPVPDRPVVLRPTKVEFRDDAQRAGLDFRLVNGETAIRQLPTIMSGGVGLLDYDGDGWVDVFCVQGSDFPPDPANSLSGDRLFRNRRDGTFEDVTDSSGIAGFPRGYGHGVAMGDYDNDGLPDLLITRWRSYALYHNRGDGTFEDVTEPAGLGGDRNWPTSAAFADLDGDGDLDLYVCHYLKWDAEDPKICRDSASQAYLACRPTDFVALPDHVFRNDGGHFVDVSAPAGISDQDGRGLGVVAVDVDGDRRVDLFVANDTSANYLFRNLGGFRFEEVAHAAGVAGNAAGGYQAGMGVACGDLDGDGRPELVVTNYYGESTSLFQNLGGGLFSDQTTASGLAIPSRHLLGFGASFLDANNDGHLDLLTANGHVNRIPGSPAEMPVQLLLGDGVRLSDSHGSSDQALAMPRMGRGLAVGDLDNDGRLDALVVNQKGPLAYLHNQTRDGGRFVMFKLEGTRSNRDGVGARVSVLAGGRRHHGWRLGGGSYQSASDGRLHFGLGTAERLEAVEVAWPSGRVDNYGNLAADAGYLLREGSGKAEPLRGFRLREFRADRSMPKRGGRPAPSDR